MTCLRPRPIRESTVLTRLVDAGRELCLVLAIFGLYLFGRTLVRDEAGLAFEHAEQIQRLEAALHLPSEAAIQAWVGSEAIFRFLNVYYVSVHFPVALSFVIWGYLRRPRAEYHWARNLMIIQTGLALVIHIAFPLAPPRMFPQWGFLDTMTVYGPSAYDGASASVANQLAAMPSLHVGWAVLIAYVIARTGPRWLAIVAALHASTTIAVVILTANHWWVDGIVAVGLLAAAARILRASAPARAHSAERSLRGRPPMDGTDRPAPEEAA